MQPTPINKTIPYISSQCDRQYDAIYESPAVVTLTLAESKP